MTVEAERMKFYRVFQGLKLNLDKNGKLVTFESLFEHLYGELIFFRQLAGAGSNISSSL